MILSKLYILLFLLLISTQIFANHSPSVDQLQEELKSTTDAKKQVALLYEISTQLSYSDFDLSIKFAEDGLQIATKNQDKKNSAKFNKLLGKLYLEAGRKKEALEKIETALKIAKEEDLKDMEAKSVLTLGYYWYRLGDSTNTISNYKRAFDLYSELENNNGIAQACLKLGWGYDMFGNHPQAEKFFLKAIEMENSISDTTLLINALTGMGSYYANKSIKHHQAIQSFERALELAKSKGDQFNEGRIYNALGFLYASLDNNELAISFYLKGLNIFEQQKNKAEVCWLYTQMGEIYADKEDFDSALNYFEKALKIVDQIDRSVMQTAEIYLAIGHIHREKGEDYKKALNFFEKALELSKTTKNSYQTMNTELAIGICHVAMNNFVEGKQWCQIALDKAKTHPLLSQKACDCLYKASQSLGDYKSALLFHEKYKSLSDSLHKEELSEKIHNLAAKQEYEIQLTKMQKRQEIDAANVRIKSIITIATISLLALITIMLLSLAIVKKNAQKKQLKALSIAKKELIANISHDLRTPITVMNGYVETLLMRIGKTNEADQTKYLNIVLSSANRLEQLIEQLFEYSKLEAKQIEPIKESFQLRDLVKDTFARYQIIAQKKKIQIKMNCQEGIPVVYADVILIERVIQNLMDNALKFTPPNGEISVCLSNNKEQVQVEISDTGSGIPKEKEQLIFDRYEKSRGSKGAGLGLTIVKNILDMHGCEIQVKSELNKGTSFIFSLPTSAN